MKKITGTLIFVVIVLAALGTYNYISTLEDTVIIGYLPSDHHSALFVANEKQLYEKEGIRVQLVPFRAGPEVIEALKEGKIDVGYCGIAPVITAIDNGAPIKIVASVISRLPMCQVGTSLDSASMAVNVQTSPYPN